MKRINLFLLATTVLFAAALHAQTVDEIISKHIEAIGGKEKLGQVKSIYSEISMEVMGNQSPVTEYTLEGKGFKSEAEVNGSKIISCFTDKGGWGINPTGRLILRPRPCPMSSIKREKARSMLGVPY